MKTLALKAAAIAMVPTLALVGCGQQKGQGKDKADAGDKSGPLKVALLLPESKTTRYESQDKPKFEAKLNELAPDAKLDYKNANQDATQQQQQVEAAVTAGDSVIVLDPVDASAVSSGLKKAKDKGIPVISYDRFFKNADYYTSFDNVKIGNLQGQSVLDGLKAKKVDPKSANVWMVNGDPKDPNAADFKKGATATLKKAGVKIAKSHDAQDWDPDDARKWVEGQLQSGPKPDAIYSANDGTAGGVIAAARKAKQEPVVTGQDSEVDGLQNILRGLQYATIYKAYQPQAEFAAKAAVKLGKGDKPDAKDTYKGTPTDFVKADIVTSKNMKKIVGDQIKASDICKGDVKKLCDKQGVK